MVSIDLTIENAKTAPFPRSHRKRSAHVCDSQYSWAAFEPDFAEHQI